MDGKATRLRTIFYSLALTIVFTFLWRLTVPAHEMNESNFFILFDMFANVVALVCVVRLFLVLQVIIKSETILFLVSTLAVSVISSVGILVMRFSSETGWYTGHRLFSPAY